MKGRNASAVIVAVVVVVGGTAAFLYGGDTREIVVPKFDLMASAGTAAPSVPAYTVPPLGNEYKNSEFRFSLAVPDGFTAREMQEEDATSKTVVLQDVQGNGIQILVTPFPDAPNELTADMVKADIPDMQVTDVQVVEVGVNSHGIAFKSDNEAFGGASREVWFFFRGNLYQISTYAHLDTLMQAMFGTWKFF